MERRPTSKDRTVDPAIEPKQNKRYDKATDRTNSMASNGQATALRGRSGHPGGGRAGKRYVFQTRTKAELIKYLHQAAFSPVKATRKKAIENGHFTTWPELTTDAVEKYLPRHSPASDKGHMSRQPQGVLSTSKAKEWVAKKSKEWRQERSKDAAAWLNSEEAAEDMVLKQEESKLNELFCAVMSVNLKNGTTYMGCTGKFPVKSLDGIVTKFIMYDWSSNSILVKPIKNTKDETIIAAFKEKLEYLAKQGFKPRFNILDNIASKAIVKFLKEECQLGVQLVEPHNHRANAAERAICTYTAASSVAVTA